MENENSKNLDSQNVLVSESKKDGKVGPFIGSAIIIILIIVGGMYFWGSIVEKRFGTTSTNSLEQDADEINVEELDKEMVEIEAEFDAALAE